jgi:capsular polysaccharide transport system ATP-binding protein
MIRLNEVTKRYSTRSGVHTVLNKVNLNLEKGEKLGILGRNGAGKSTLIRIIAGAELPSNGVIQREMSVSWPLAFGGAFQSSLSGIDNLKFICRVYGVDYHEKLNYVEEFSEIGKFIYEPIKNYSAGMRARLAFAISMAIEFDCFLIDEVISVGDKRFYEKCQYELFELRKDRAMIMVSHQMQNIRKHCDKACVLIKGKLHQFDDIAEAAKLYNQT